MTTFTRLLTTTESYRGFNGLSQSGGPGGLREDHCWLVPVVLDPHGSLHRKFTDELWSSFGIDLAGELPEEAMVGLRRLRGPILAAFLLSAVAVSLQAICMVYGWVVLFRLKSVPKGSIAMWYWALGYCCAVCSLGICLVPAELAVVSCIALAEVAHRLSDGCAGELCSLRDVALQVGLPSVACIALAAGVAHLTLRRMRQIHGRWCEEGPAPEEVVSIVVSASMSDQKPQDAECIVCMTEGSDMAKWTKLKCNHCFHETCLREWLSRSSRCPLCRLDLRKVYLDP